MRENSHAKTTNKETYKQTNKNIQKHKTVTHWRVWTAGHIVQLGSALLEMENIRLLLFNIEERKVMFYLTGWKEGNALFNDVLNTFYLWLYGVKW